MSYGSLMLESSGKLYGMITQGGMHSYGVNFCFAPLQMHLFMFMIIQELLEMFPKGTCCKQQMENYKFKK